MSHMSNWPLRLHTVQKSSWMSPCEKDQRTISFPPNAALPHVCERRGSVSRTGLVTVCPHGVLIHLFREKLLDIGELDVF